MDEIEAGKLLAYCAAFDNRKPSLAANIAWAEALGDIPGDPDAYSAVARYYAEPTVNGELDGTRWVQPHHVRLIRRRIRDERIPDGAFTYPALGREESGVDFVERRRAQIQAIADGRLPAEPIREITGGPHPSVANVVRQIGQMPDGIRDQLAEAGIGRRRATWPELAIPCPLHDCRAAAHRPCRRPSGKDMKQGTHPSRRDAWAASQHRGEATG